MSDHQPDLNFTPPEAHARRTDGPHSHEAARSVRNTEKVRANVRFILEQHGPLTDEEIAAHYALGFEPKSSPSGLRTRRNELVADNKVRASTRVGRTAANRACGVWEIVK